MRIELQPDGDLLELHVEGLLDNEVAGYLRATVDDVIREGWHRIVVNLQRVSYLSSAGISALLQCRQQLKSIHGFFGVCDPGEHVRLVLEQTRLMDVLVVNRDAVRGPATTGTMTLHSFNRVASEQGIELELYNLEADAVQTCRVLGRPDRLFDGGFRAGDCRAVAFPASTFGLGLGAFGAGFEQCRSRFGDFLAVAGGAAQSPTHAFGVADYLLAAGDFVPEVQVLYGLQCAGDFAHLIRFHASDAARPVGLCNLVNQCLSFAGYPCAAIVMLAECVGLVGAVLRRSPALETAPAQAPFGFPEIRNWVSFSSEQTYRRSLSIVVGVAVRGRPQGATEALASFVRPLDHGGAVSGHFHAAVFPHRPLKKRTLPLGESVKSLFDSGTLQGVLHLLNDERPISGAGETQMLDGGCWLAPLREVVAEGP